MKDFINIFVNDFKAEGFTRKQVMIYGVGANLALVVGCMIAELIAK